jgi:hypothetical protein
MSQRGEYRVMRRREKLIGEEEREKRRERGEEKRMEYWRRAEEEWDCDYIAGYYHARLAFSPIGTPAAVAHRPLGSRTTGASCRHHTLHPVNV